MISNFYPYLRDSDFLKKVDNYHSKTQLVKITLLDFDENIIREIQGEVTDGSVQLNAGQEFRRSADISLIADEFSYERAEDNFLFSIDKKVNIEIGIKNVFNEYLEYDIIWFPMGVFIIESASASRGTNGLTVSLSLMDKMSNLNGFCGGTLPAEVRFDEVEYWDVNVQSYVTEKIPIFDLIFELVNHYGKENVAQIIINDVPETINSPVRLSSTTGEMKILYIGYSFTNATKKSEVPDILLSQDTPDYLRIALGEDGKTPDEIKDYFNSIGKKGIYKVIKFLPGEDVGYVKDKLYYISELTSAAGSSVVDVLNQVKNYLGNYEFFYDVNGNFIFQEVKNYLNTMQGTTLERKLVENPEFEADFSKGRTDYSFNDATLVASFSNQPQYSEIKNDFIVWGKRKGASGNPLDFRYRVCIDEKPTVGKKYKVFFQGDVAILIIEDYPTLADLKASKIKKTNVVFKVQEGYYYYNINTKKYSKISNPEVNESYVVKDWRDELYFSGMLADYANEIPNDYYEELVIEWPQLYNFREQKFKEDVLKGININYFLDFIDASSSSIGHLSVKNIGRRTMVISDDKINCIFEPDIPNIFWEEANEDGSEDHAWDPESRIYKAPQDIYKCLINLGGKYNGAFYKVQEVLYQNTDYQEAISLTTLPIYYLEPNTKITVSDQKSGIDGEYLINSISIPLGVEGTTNINCSKVLTRI